MDISELIVSGEIAIVACMIIEVAQGVLCVEQRR